MLCEKKCKQDAPQHAYANQVRAIEKTLEMGAVLTSAAALPARSNAERDHSTAGPREKYARGHP